MSAEEICERVSRIRIQLDQKPAKVNELIRRLKSAVEEDHNTIFSYLKSACAVILTPGISPTANTSNLNVPLDDLDAAIALHYVHIEHLNTQTQALSLEVSRIGSALESCRVAGESILQRGSNDTKAQREREEVEQRRREAEIAEQQRREAEQAEILRQRRLLQEEQDRLNTLRNKMENNRDKRIGLRAARVAAWGATLLFPPAAVVAAGMEFGAHKVRKKARAQEEAYFQHSSQIHSITTQLSSTSSPNGPPPAYSFTTNYTTPTTSKPEPAEAPSPAMKSLEQDVKTAIPTLSNDTDGLAKQVEMLRAISESTVQKANELFQAGKKVRSTCETAYSELAGPLWRGSMSSEQAADWFRHNSVAATSLGNFLERLKCSGRGAGAGSLDELLKLSISGK